MLLLSWVRMREKYGAKCTLPMKYDYSIINVPALINRLIRQCDSVGKTPSFRCNNERFFSKIIYSRDELAFTEPYGKNGKIQ